MLNNLTTLKNIKSRSISAENLTGEKGKGGMASEGTYADSARDLGIGWKISPSIIIEPHTTATLADIKTMGAIKHMWMTDSKRISRSMILRVYYDDSPVPSIETPHSDFFASTRYFPGFSQLSSLAVCVNPQSGFNSYWEMPFKKRYLITLENITDETIELYYQIDYEEKEIPENSAYFHAQFRRINPLPYKEVYTILDNVHGKGHYVGTYVYWGVNNNKWWGEGEVKFYLDGDKEFPTICTTGTEDYFGGSYCFDCRDGKYTEYTTPYAGMHKVERGDGMYNSQQRFSLYRWHICDPVYFEEDIKVTMQALGWRSGHRFLPLQDDISSVAYWYQDTICDTFPILPDADYLELI